MDVAIAFRTSDVTELQLIYSYVNLARTIGDGSHVDGLFDGVGAFLGGRRQKADCRWVISMVSVILADVLYGAPTRDRMNSPYARAPVAAATKTALDAWATSHQAELKALQSRRAQG